MRTKIPAFAGDEDLPEVSRYYDELVRVYHYTDVEAADTERYNLRELVEGEDLDLVHEPENAFDKGAIALKSEGRTIGYLPANRLRDMVHDFRKHGGEALACVRSIDGNRVVISLGYYQVSDYEYQLKLESGQKYQTVKLAGDSIDEMQGNRWCLSVGERVELQKDGETDKLLVIADEEVVGYLPKDAEYLGEGSSVFVAEIVEDDDGMLSVSVAVFQ